jgi:hypothetical protein
VPIAGPTDAGSAAANASANSSGGTSGTAPTVASSAAADAGKPPTKLAAGQKTLERQAIDYVATGEYQKAIGLYEQLARQAPERKEYPEALRILRQKLDAGAP